MKTEERAEALVWDLEPKPADFENELVEGLRRKPKTIPCKFFYDARGSQLFDEICELEEYYLTRTEREILQENIEEIAERCGPDCVLVELGSGSSRKTRLLLERLERPGAYVPLDISRPHLVHAAEELSGLYPWLEIRPICADYLAPIDLPLDQFAVGKKVLFFPGSTIGNFKPSEACAFLRRLGAWCEPGDGMIIGVDMVKDSRVIERAYNDRQGVTAAFNLNVLDRANRELGADFQVNRFRHEAVFDRLHSRIEMHLVSQCPQRVNIGGACIYFTAGERIVTEYSYKYQMASLEELFRASGWRLRKSWFDPQQWFGVFYLEHHP